MKRREIVEKLGENSPFILNHESCACLIQLQSELQKYCIGAKAYQEIDQRIDDFLNTPMNKGVRSLNLKPFVSMTDETKRIMEQEWNQLKYRDEEGKLKLTKDLSMDEVEELLVAMAKHPEMYRLIELLVGYPAWRPHGTWDEASIDVDFFRGREEDYDYTYAVITADDETLRDALGWMEVHNLPMFFIP